MSSVFMQNKPNFPYFSAKNEDYTKKQTQTNPIQTQYKPNLASTKESVFSGFLLTTGSTNLFIARLYHSILPKWHKSWRCRIHGARPYKNITAYG
jgi:hypothetical protein